MHIAVNGWFAGQLATGSGQYLAGLQAWLPGLGRGHHFTLVVPPGREHAWDAGAPPGWQVVPAGTPLDSVSANLAKVWFEQVTFPRACRRLRAEVALVPYWGSPWWRPCPILVTIHDIIPLLLPLYRGGLLPRAYTALVAHTARRAAMVLTDSEASLRDIVTHLAVPPAHVRAVHLAADPGFRPVADEAELARVRAKYGVPDEPIWLYLGGFDVRKNLLRLLEAYARLLRRTKDGQVGRVPPLVIAGRLPTRDSEFAPDPRPIARRLGVDGAVHFTGWIDEADKPALYSLASAALFVSEYEGFGLPVLEAQACGCPVLTSANGLQP